MSYGYSISNVLASLGATSFKDGALASLTNGSYLNDIRLDKQAAAPSSPYAATFNLIVDMGSAVNIGGFALLNHNCVVDSAGGTVQVLVDAADDNAFAVNLVHPKTATSLYAGTDVYDVRRKDHVLQFPSVAKRWWKLGFTYAANLSPVIGELFAFGAPVTLPRTSIYGSGEGEEVFGPEVNFNNGNRSAYLIGGPLKTKSYQYADLSASDLNAFRTLWRSTKGFALPFLWLESVESIGSGATTAGQECVYGRLELPGFEWAQDDFGIYQPSNRFGIRSLGREVGA